MRWWPLLVLAAASVAAFATGLHHYLSLELVVDRRDLLKGFVADHWAASIAAFAAIYVAVVTLSLPGGLVMTVAGGFLFGWLLGGLVTLFSATLGASLVFLIARTSLAEPLAARAGPALTRLLRGFRQDAASYLLFLRLVPVFPFWLVNLAPSLAGIPFRIYVVTTFIGIMPGTFAFSVAGAGLDSLVEAQRNAYAACLVEGLLDCRMSFDVDALLTPQLLAAFAALGLIALMPAVVRRLGGHKFLAQDPEKHAQFSDEIMRKSKDGA